MSNLRIETCTHAPKNPLSFDVYEEEQSHGIDISFWHNGNLVALGIARDTTQIPDIIHSLKESRSAWSNARLTLHKTKPTQSLTTLELWGTPFQCHVLKTLVNFKGASLSYGELAALCGHPRAARAVGTALGRNPICRYIPCHKVVQSGGKVGSYRWGTAVKEKLLAEERARWG